MIGGILLGLLALLAGLVWQMPAATAIAWLPAERVPTLHGLQGQVSGGHLSRLTHGRFSVGPLQWSVSPWSLLWLHPGAQIELERPLLARGHVRLSPTGRLALTDWQASADARDLLDAFGYTFIPLAGVAGLQLDSLRLHGNRPSAIHGRIELRNLVWALGSQRLPIGDVEAVIAPQEGIEMAEIRDLGGPLAIEGSARLEADGRYDLKLRVKARANADPRLANLLRGLGRPDNQAYYPIRYSGQLVP